jgi:ABC-type branched-subunit amino acid transport system substrate-binding protein
VGSGRAFGGALALAALVSATTSGCTSSKGAPPSPPPREIVIGVSFGLTGSLGSFTAPLQNAIRVAEGQINALGGVLGRPVRMQIVDDTTDEGAVVQKAVSGLLDAGVSAIIGPAGSGQVVAAAKLAQDRHVVMISPSATSTDLTTLQPAKDRYFFRTVPADDLQGKAVSRFALRGPPARGGADAGVDAGSIGSQFCTTMGIVHIDNSYGNAMAKVIVDYMTQHGGTVPLQANITVPVTAKDHYTDEVNAILGSGAKCQALIAYDDVGDAYMRELKKNSLPPSFIVIGTDGIYTDAFITNGRNNKADPASPTIAEGVYGTNPDTNPPTPEFGDFTNLYNAYYPLKPGAQPDAYTANTYDAAMLILLAIAQAGTATDGQKIRDALYDVSKGGTAYGPAQIADALEAIKRGEDIDYKGASGNVDLDDNGNTISDYIVWEVVNGKYTDPPVDRIKAGELLQ